MRKHKKWLAIALAVSMVLSTPGNQALASALTDSSEVTEAQSIDVTTEAVVVTSEAVTEKQTEITETVTEVVTEMVTEAPATEAVTEEVTTAVTEATTEEVTEATTEKTSEEAPKKEFDWREKVAKKKQLTSEEEEARYKKAVEEKQKKKEQKEKEAAQKENSDEIKPVMAALGTPASGTCGKITEINPTGDNLTWTLDEDGVLTISGTGEMADFGEIYDEEEGYYTVNPPWGDSITKVIFNQGITSIGDNAFYDCYDLEEISVIPEGVTYIGDYAFRGCEYLEGTLKLPESITYIGEEAFVWCNFSGNLILPNSIKYIGYRAFSDCYSFEGEVTLPDTLEYLGAHAFWDDNFTNKTITIPATVSYFYSNAFEGWSKLESIIVDPASPYYVTDEQGIIWNKTYTEVVFFPASITEFLLPDTMTDIDFSNMFSNCNNLEKINISDSNTTYSSIDGVVYSKDKTVLIYYPKGRKGTEYRVQPGTKKIEAYAFDGNNEQLCTWYFPASIETLDYNIINVWSEDNLEYKIYFEGNAPTMDEYCFEDREFTCYYPEGNTTWTTDKFQNYYGTISWISWNSSNGTEGTTILGTDDGGILWKLDRITGILTFDGTGYLEDYLQGWDSYRDEVKTIKIGEGVTYIYYDIFDRCINLTKIEIDAANENYSTDENSIIYSKDMKTLYYCPYLQKGKLILSEGVETINDYAFRSGEWEAITLPKSLKTLGQYTFSGADILNLVIAEGNTLYHVTDGVLYDNVGNCIFCTKGKQGTLTVEAGTTTIKEDAFQRSKVESIILPSGVTTLEDYAITGNAVRSVTIPSTVITIAEYAFGDEPEYLFIVEAGSEAEKFVINNGFSYRYQDERVVEIYGSWRFNLEYSTFTVKLNEKIPADKLKPAENADYEFLGYYCGNQLVDSDTPVTEDMILQPRFKVKQLSVVPNITGTASAYGTVSGNGRVMGTSLDVNKTLWSFSDLGSDKVTDNVNKYYATLVYGDEERNTYWNNVYVIDKDNILSFYSKNSVEDSYVVEKICENVKAVFCHEYSEHNLMLTMAGDLIDIKTKEILRKNVKEIWSIGYDELVIIDTDGTLRVCYIYEDKFSYSAPLNSKFKGKYVSPIPSNYYELDYYAEAEDGTIWNVSEGRAVGNRELALDSDWSGNHDYYLNPNGEIFYYEYDEDDNATIHYLDYEAASLGGNGTYLSKTGAVYDIDTGKQVLEGVQKIAPNGYDETMYLTNNNELFVSTGNADETLTQYATKLMSGVKDFTVYGWVTVITTMDSSVWIYNIGAKDNKLVEVVKAIAPINPPEEPKEEPTTQPKEEPTTQPKEEPTTQPKEEPTTEAPKEVVVPAVTNFKQSKNGKTSITIAWDKMDCDGYEIYRKPYKSGSYKLVKTVSKFSKSYTDKKLKKETLYKYKIRAFKNVNGTKKYGSYTKEIVGNTAINDVKLSKAKSNAKKQITLTWKKVKNISGYAIYRATKKNGTYKKIATVKSSKTSYTDKKCKSKTKYYYKVRTYKKISGKTVYGSYSKIKSDKAK